MAAYYGKKIRNGMINPKTGAAWQIEDVPSLWREAARKWLEEA